MKKLLYTGFSRIIPKALASTSRPFYYPFLINILFYLTDCSLQKSITYSGVDNLYICILGLISLHDSPMFSAVSSLSPVSIHILIPASCNEAIVWGTSSWSLSSTAVPPIKTISLSNSS